ncbi:MAG: ABC transporter ATP-binding protein, partial [Clostridiales bacterium]|nr:ABC transporter ATP-binding protein [Clostridiales bacterium]
VKMIKSYSKESYMERLYQHRIDENFKTIHRVNFLDSIYSPIIQVTRAVTISLIVILASNQIQLIGISLGMVAACIELISNLFGPIEALGMELQSIQSGLSGIKRMNDFYEEPEEIEKNDRLTAETILKTAEKNCLTFENVCFSYDGDTQVFDHLNADIQTGTTVTFMGRTGIGKTTLFRLIMGLLRPTSGSIKLGAYEVSKIPNSQKRKIFGYVDQQFLMIEGTIADQISLKDENITREQILQSLDFVGLMDYVNHLPDGIDTPLTATTTLSQGQKQLLSIARAIVANPPILLLDEITASLDSATEAYVVDVLQKAKAGRTVLSISHRNTSVLQFDKLIHLT